MFDAIRQDIRYAIRGLRRQPGFTAAIVITLALGIGANAAMFGVTDRLLFRPPAFMKDPDRVHQVYLVRTFDGEESYGSHFQYTRYADLRRWTTAFDQTAAFTETRAAVGVGENAREMRIGAVSASYWAFFDAQPVIGRLFTAAEDTTPAGSPVAVLSYPLWQSEYGGRSDVLGQQLKLARLDYTIIGVMPRGFGGMSANGSPVAWVPITTWAGSELSTFSRSDPNNWFQKYNISWMSMLARRKPGTSVEVATADLTNAYRRSYQAQRDMSPQTTIAEIAKPRAVAGSVLAARGPDPSGESKVARWVSGIALVVMLIACANVANLLLARALRRRREIAVRRALGVTRRRLASQLLVESVLLAALGGAVGLVLAQWGGAILGAQFLPDADRVSVVDGRTLLFSAVAVLVVGLLAGVVPAMHSTRGDLTSSLKSGAREGTYNRSPARIALLVTQGALSVMLLIGAGLFVRSLDKVLSLRMGYDIEPLLWVSVQERGESLGATQRLVLRERLREEAASLPGVVSAARAVTVPFYITWSEDISVPGIDSATMTKFGEFSTQAGSPEILSAMGTRLLRGRGIDPTDTKDAPKVVVVSESMARRLWPGRDALGECVRLGGDSVPCTTVVGITEDVRTSDDFAEDKRQYYFKPIDQAAGSPGGLFVRVRGDAERSAEGVRRALQKLMPGTAYVTVRPMSEIFGPKIRSWRLGATMFVTFGGLALVLAAVGLYSVIAYNVAQRMHEMGVRTAFGAAARDLVALILREGLLLTALGLVIGAAVAALAGRWVGPLLFGVGALDPAVFASVAGVLLLVGAAASIIPAMRAARVDPTVALRSD